MESGLKRKSPGCPCAHNLGYQKAKQALAHKIGRREGGDADWKGHRAGVSAQWVAVGQAERHAKLTRLEESSEANVQQVAG